MGSMQGWPYHCPLSSCQALEPRQCGKEWQLIPTDKEGGETKLCFVPVSSLGDHKESWLENLHWAVLRSWFRSTLEGKMAKRPRDERWGVKEMPNKYGHCWCKWEIISEIFVAIPMHRIVVISLWASNLWLKSLLLQNLSLYLLPWQAWTIWTKSDISV